MQSNLVSISPDKLREKLHVGIIMDGNGRWATRRGLSRLRGHEAGVEAIRRIVEAAPDWMRARCVAVSGNMRSMKKRAVTSFAFIAGAAPLPDLASTASAIRHHM